ncbi:peptide chain release factor N(5)-glutamine methyltransferase [Candidatus Binatus sp.]|jgi:release factor glutamine methyltransferase|uniref:peptide chain release factor N(5)-glutamine methyltransferase n=1 Tax=Candidatus Binatus sp. TaxID=2811406 RepID=UPI003BEA2FA6
MSEVLARRALEEIDKAARRLAVSGIESARLDAELLMAAAAGVTRAAVITGSIDLSPATLNNFATMIARREKREPIAYLLGRKEFYSLDFQLSPAVLIPRPESEIVVAAALKLIAGAPDARVLDIGTGSGAIAIAIAVNAPRVRVTAVDISADAIAVASRNAEYHRVEDRVTLRRADCFDILDGGSALGSFELIVSNPPYLDDAELAALEPDVRAFEPRVALSAGAGGLDIFRRIAAGAPRHLASDGELIVEVAAGQAAAVARLFEAAGLRVVSVINDFAGHPRVVRARRSGA